MCPGCSPSDRARSAGKDGNDAGARRVQNTVAQAGGRHVGWTKWAAAVVHKLTLACLAGKMSLNAAAGSIQQKHSSPSFSEAVFTSLRHKIRKKGAYQHRATDEMALQSRELELHRVAVLLRLLIRIIPKYFRSHFYTEQKSNV